ncbi:DUF1345 domain-containing protein [Propionibacteriaceae bacterium G57]|uniref:DUF1345 domain-containing protein n=1 Tax=Aestuariimicrobium sp. G57 TaxID=3418485 RepID=UPI003DA7A2BE
MARVENDQLRLWGRLTAAALTGVVAGLLVPLPPGAAPFTPALVGFIVGSVVFCVPLLVRAMAHDEEQTRARVDGLGESRSVLDVLIVLAAVTGLAAVATMLVGARTSGPGGVFNLVVPVAAVVAAWVLLHTGYVLRYAKHYVNAEPGCIGFAGDGEPVMSDFVYLSFCLGMTYQVSDQELKTTAVRRIVLWHTLLSYLFGTVVIASTINLLVGLAGTGG